MRGLLIRSIPLKRGENYIDGMIAPEVTADTRIKRLKRSDLLTVNYEVPSDVCPLVPGAGCWTRNIVTVWPLAAEGPS